MFELNRDTYAEVFNFDLFHNCIRRLRESSRREVCINLRKFVTDKYDLWFNYQPSTVPDIVYILTTEIFEQYGTCVDPEDNVCFSPIKKTKPERETDWGIRDLAKECLAKSQKPLPEQEIFDYVQTHRNKEIASVFSLRMNLLADKENFVSYPDKRFGLASVDYPEAYYRTFQTIPTDLCSQEFELRYSTKRTFQPVDFFTKALSNSSHLDLGLGYFSSASFNVLACGFSHFIKNGGNIRMYINPNLTEDDYALLKANKNEEFEERLLESYEELFNILSKRDELFFRCLAYLIQQKRIEIRIAVLKEGGIAHEKFGIFTDTNGNEVVFNGSMNLTASGLTRNIESIDCICSWNNEENKQRIATYHNDFDSVWDGSNKDVIIYEAEDFCQKIVTRYQHEKLDAIVLDETKTIHELKETSKEERRNEPHFPSKFSGAFQYQKDAYQAWCERGKQGVFAMATGTGKTITSLNCALEEYYNDGFYRLIILVPSIALVEQWEEEVNAFNFTNIIKVSSTNNQWRASLLSLKGKLERGKTVNYVVISTYTSFGMDDFQLLLPSLSENAILIADEAHNIGANKVRDAFRRMTIKRRIALSATLQRIYDEEGTQEIESFFNDRFPYTYSFSMSKAIKMGRLMHYYYYPHIVYLDEDEMSAYAHYTRQLVQLYNSSNGSYSDPDKAQQLLMLRKNVLHKARNKMQVYVEIIRKIGEDNLKYCFVYSASGKRYDQQKDENEQYDIEILKHMLTLTKEIFPSVRCNSYTSNDSKELRKQKLDAFAAGQIDILFAKNCLDEGVDVPRAEFGIFTSSTGNPRQFVQRRGRLLRTHPDKRFAFIYDMIVSPNFHSPQYDQKWWNMEKSLVVGEMRRVANFACLADNYYTGAINQLHELLDFYQVDLDGLVLIEEEKNK